MLAKCKGNMKMIAFIEEETVIRKILKHLNLWITVHDPPLLSKVASKNEPHLMVEPTVIMLFSHQRSFFTCTDISLTSSSAVVAFLAASNVFGTIF